MVFTEKNSKILSILKTNVGSHIRQSTKEESAHLELLKQMEEQTYKKLIVSVISGQIALLLNKNDPKAAGSNRTVFDSKVGVPGVTIQSYLERIIQYAPCSPECFLISLVYIDRLITCSNLLVTSLNIHRLLITTIMLASKLFDDVVYSNKHFSIVGGIEITELNTLELAFFQMVGFRLVVNTEQFVLYQTLVEKIYALANPETEDISENYEAIVSSPSLPRKKAFQVFGALRRSKSCAGFTHKPRLDKAVNPAKVNPSLRSSSFQVFNQEV